MDTIVHSLATLGEETLKQVGSLLIVSHCPRLLGLVEHVDAYHGPTLAYRTSLGMSLQL
jgi:hypothetical protein